MSLSEELYVACEQKNITGKSWAELAGEYNFGNSEKLRGRFRRESKDKNTKQEFSADVENDELNENNYRATEEIKQDGSVISDKLIKIREMDSKNPTNLLEAHGFDPEKWILINAKNNFWNGMRPKDRGLATLYQSKIVAKPREESEITFSQVEKFFNDFVPTKFSNGSEIRQYKKDGLVLEVDLADAHVGNESISFDNLRKRVVHLVEEIKERSKGLTFEKIYLVQLGDVFHFDGYNRQTTGGTQVTYGSNFYTMYQNGMDLLIWVIEELAKISKVEVINIYGNHDKVNSFTLAKTIEAYFRNNEDVFVDASVEIRKFRKIGNNSVAFVHGDMPKVNIYNTFQKEARKMFGETLYSEIHLGHLHHEISDEKNGVILRYLPSLTTPDEWHQSQGYTGAKQGTHCFVWDKESGLSNIWMITA